DHVDGAAAQIGCRDDAAGEAVVAGAGHLPDAHPLGADDDGDLASGLKAWRRGGRYNDAVGEHNLRGAGGERSYPSGEQIRLTQKARDEMRARAAVDVLGRALLFDDAMV